MYADKVLSVENLKPGEEVEKKWFDLRFSQRWVVAKLHSAKGKIQVSKLQRILDVAQPFIVIGRNEKGDYYCRISKQSVEVVKLLIKNYG